MGKHDCALFAINVIKRLYDIDYGERIRGQYSSKFEYLKLWEEIGGSSLKEITDIITEKQSEEMRKVNIGYLVLYVDDNKGEHLGICIGDKVAVVSIANKLLFYDIFDCKCCWRIN